MSLGNTEKNLLEGLQRGDKSVIEQIYKNEFPVIRSMIINNNGTEEDAADIFQEAMIVLYEKSIEEAFQLSCLIRTYLYSVSRNLWLKRLNKSSILVDIPSGMEEKLITEDDIHKHEEKERDFEKMRMAMSKIGEPCKSLLTAYYINRKPMHVIANDFGYTNADNAKTQKYKCLVRLKKIFFGNPIKNNA